jgi:chemosensory pili system protein ChpA (sensor histidine kinase/response regulator)
MDDEFNQNELSAEDLAILQAFDEMDLEGWEVERSEKGISTRPLTDQEMGIDFLAPEELLAIFVREASEDIAAIRQTLQQLEPDDHLESARLQVIQRTAHKLKGSTGAMGCTAMSTIAHHIEELVKLIASGTIVPFIGLNALVQTVRALETTLNSLVTSGVESSDPLTELGAEYQALNIEIASGRAEKQALSTAAEEEQETAPRVYLPLGATVEAEPFSKAPQESHTTLHVVRVEVDRFEQLILHTEQLAELSSPLESAQAEVEKALQELQTAQARLRHLEVLVSAQLVAKASSATIEPNGNGERPTSSLIARILDEARQRTGQHYQRKSKAATRLVKKADSFQWDDLEIDRFTENDVLAHSLGEAIADVATASAQLRAAYAQLSRIAQQHINQATNVRNDTLLLSLAPISALVPRIERAVMMSALAQQHQVLFETEGETTEIDQEILEKVMQPLLQLVRTCTAYGSQTATKTGAAERGNATDRIWLHVHTVDNEVNIEVGFSMTVAGGALDEVQEAIRRLNGTIVARRNNLGGISFHLRLPRSQGAIQGFLVAVGNRRVVVPLTQVQRIEPGKKNRGELPYTLNSLLGFPMEQALPESERAALILQTEGSPLAVQVDAILGETKLVVKPLAPHLHRQGIIGTAIDGRGNILLIVDLPELINRYEIVETTAKVAAIRSGGQQPPSIVQKQPSILVADDSVYIRQSLHQTLSYAGYKVSEADDGMKTLERLLDYPPDALLLDIEMPNLNGYDVLSMMRAHPELAKVKTIMLTSRTSEKHKARARELGAHAYLTKPCPQDVLLETLRSLLMN